MNDIVDKIASKYTIQELNEAIKDNDNPYLCKKALEIKDQEGVKYVSKDVINKAVDDVRKKRQTTFIEIRFIRIRGNMAGFQQRKVFCQGLTRKSKRPCRAKGYPTANGKYLCRFHGGNNIKGFNQKNYTDDTRIKALSKLKQFRDKTREEVRTILLQRNQT